jgi:hypothetical protein
MIRTSRSVPGGGDVVEFSPKAPLNAEGINKNRMAVASATL